MFLVLSEWTGLLAPLAKTLSLLAVGTAAALAAMFVVFMIGVDFGLAVYFIELTITQWVFGLI